MLPRPWRGLPGAWHAADGVSLRVDQRQCERTGQLGVQAQGDELAAGGVGDPKAQLVQVGWTISDSPESAVIEPQLMTRARMPRTASDQRSRHL